MKEKLYIACLIFISAVQLYSQETTSDRIEAYGLYYSGSYGETIALLKKIESNKGPLLPDDRLILGISEFKTGNFVEAL
jgi:hypothetical protein